MKGWQISYFNLFYLVRGEVDQLDQWCLSEINRGNFVCLQVYLFEEGEVGEVYRAEEIGWCNQLLKLRQFLQN